MTVCVDIYRPMVSEVHNTRSSQEQEADPSAQLEVFLQQQQRKQPPSRQADESGALGGMAGAASFQNMAQLLNLAGKWGKQGEKNRYGILVGAVAQTTEVA